MPFTRFALILCYVAVAAGITVFLFAQLDSRGQGGQMLQLVLPLAMIAALAIRALQKRLSKDEDS